MSELFISTCKSLRDEVVSELKEQNNFLRKNFNSQLESILSGTKIKISPYRDMGTIIIESECEGIYLKFLDYKALILLKDTNNQKVLRTVPLECIIFIDDNLDKLFD
jgi:hypothetical protein